MKTPPNLRAPDQVMRLSRLGSMHMSRLSVSRSVVRRARRLGWRMWRERFALDAQGHGVAIYAVDLGGRIVSLVAFSQYLPDELRMDRVIATAWDTSYVLYDGVPDAAEIERLRANVPRQEAGRFSRKELILARANKSVRSFGDVVDALSRGRQPDAQPLREAGYLLRTSAVYGNGKFGIADREDVVSIPGLAGAFTAELLTVWLIRSFSVDLAEHCAAARAAAAGGRAARLAAELRRDIGIGNSTGLGMAPFIVRHPMLLHRWIMARENALANALRSGTLDEARRGSLQGLMTTWLRKIGFWTTQNPEQTEAIARLDQDLRRLNEIVAAATDPQAVLAAAEAELGVEAQELTISLLIDSATDDDGDRLADMADDGPGLHPAAASGGCARALDALLRRYDWAMRYDFTSADADARFWYTSQEKIEPRIGWRGDDEGEELEQPLGVARDIQRLAAALRSRPASQELDAFLAAHPECRHSLRRLHMADAHPYAEIRDNLLDASIRPRDMMRAKLSFLGADFFDPASEMSVKVRFFQGAPFPDDPSAGLGDGMW
ncbi:MAG: hypothetical protein ACK5MQ_14260 [Pikeienuella sp.]